MSSSSFTSSPRCCGKENTVVVVFSEDNRLFAAPQQNKTRPCCREETWPLGPWTECFWISGCTKQKSKPGQTQAFPGSASHTDPQGLAQSGASQPLTEPQGLRSPRGGCPEAAGPADAGEPPGVFTAHGSPPRSLYCPVCQRHGVQSTGAEHRCGPPAPQASMSTGPPQTQVA